MHALVRRLLPQGPVDLLRQIVLFCGAYWLYRLVRGQVYGEAALAYAHAASIVHLERSLHVFVSGYEIVLEQYAPPSLFHPVDHVAFSPMKRSLRISKTF